MNYNSLISIASFSPNHIQPPNAWVGHLPFAAWIIKQTNPKTFVELGTHSGNSYFSFCQAVKEENLPTKCYAVDTWIGDEHAGFYGEEVYSHVSAHNREHYAEFSSLLRMTFDEAIRYFADGTIDLLHIDGLHTYETVKNDFETWLPKLASGAFVMFHDINVRERNFGVWKLWEELQQIYPLNLEFVHSHGLGVVQISNNSSEKQFSWMVSGALEQYELKRYLAALGVRQLERFDLNNLQEAKMEYEKTINNCNRSLDEQNETIAKLNQSINDFNQVINDNNNQVASLKECIDQRDGTIASLNQILTASEEQVSNLNLAVNEHNKQLKGLNELLSYREEQIRRCHDKQEEIIRGFHNTRTWRLTQPLRSAANIARRLRG